MVCRYPESGADTKYQFLKIRERVSQQSHMTNMGSLYELNYDIALTNENAEKELIDAIRCRNGNLTVICGRKDYNQMEEL